MVIVAETDEELAKGRDAMRPRLAFYGSTPAYKVVLDAHGWGELQPELNRLSKTGDWATMASMITDEIVDTFVVSGTPEADRARGCRSATATSCSGCRSTRPTELGAERVARCRDRRASAASADFAGSTVLSMILIWGFRARAKAVATGEFFCTTCGADRSYVLQHIRRWFTFFFIPLFPVGKALGEQVKCSTCGTRVPPRGPEHPDVGVVQ